jgi:glycosyltransferase involved in cell wall biosynthesis
VAEPTPLVSVVIPTYYRNEHLKRALESVIAQTYEPVEIIVVDDSGEGNASRVVDEYPNIEFLTHEQNQGAQAARTNGIERAEGKYVNLLDDDDRMKEDKLKKQVELIESDSEVGVVYCGKEWENGHKILPNHDIRGDVLEHALQFQTTPSSPSAMLIEKAVLADILPLADRPGADDLGMKIELAERTKFDFVDEPLLVQGHAEESRGGSMGAVSGRKQILKEYANLYKTVPNSVYQTALAHTYLLEAHILLNQHTWSLDAIKSAVLALYHIPSLRPTFAGYAIASLFGRPGRRFAWKLYDRLMLGDEHRGGLT